MGAGVTRCELRHQLRHRALLRRRPVRPIELGVTRLDELAQAHAPTWDDRDLEPLSGSPCLAYGDDNGRLDLFDMCRTVHATAAPSI